MSVETRRSGWSRGREIAFAACTVWLVLQNLTLLALATWHDPVAVLASGAGAARTVVGVGVRLLVPMAVLAAGLALVAVVVHARAARPAEVRHER